MVVYLALRAILGGMASSITQSIEVLQDLRTTVRLLMKKASLRIHFELTGAKAYYPPPSSRHAYVDGSVLRGQAGFAVYYGPGDRLNALVSVVGSSDINCVELMAIAWTVFYHPSDADLAIFSDSRFALQAIRRELDDAPVDGDAHFATGDAACIVRFVACLLQLRSAKTAFHKVRSHTGIEGNNTVDALAKQACRLKAVCVPIPRRLSAFTLLRWSFRFIRRQHAAAGEFPSISRRCTSERSRDLR